MKNKLILLITTKLLMLMTLNSNGAEKQPFIFFEGGKYNLSSFSHPSNEDGGIDLSQYYGKDVTTILKSVHGNQKWANILKKYKVQDAKQVEYNEQEPLLPKFGLYHSKQNKNSLNKLDSIKIFQEFKKKVLNENKTPCVAARCVLNSNNIGVLVTDSRFGSKDGAREHIEFLIQTMLKQSNEWEKGNYFTSLVIIFGKDTLIKDERVFEKKLFKHLRKIQEIDPHEKVSLKYPDDSQAFDPNNSKYEYFVNGRNYFIVGLYPQASMRSRDFEYPTIIFNASEQFQWLRNTKQMSRFQSATRKRDARLVSNKMNPNIEKYKDGDHAEGRQYSGVDHSEEKDYKVDLIDYSIQVKNKEKIVSLEELREMKSIEEVQDLNNNKGLFYYLRSFIW